MIKIKLTQKCCEWMALLGMANMLVGNYNELIKVLNEEDAIVFGMALCEFEKQWPDSLSCGSTTSIVFQEEHIELLKRLVYWFDDYFLSHAPVLERIDEEGFLRKYAQVGLVKRNLIQNATVIESPAQEDPA